RAGRYLVAVNPRREPGVVPLGSALPGGRGGAVRPGGAADPVAVRPLDVQGVRVVDGELRADGFSYGVFELV
ncbi:hypothetical protein ACFVXQ_29730, partial [Kitasatospora sp. NPDC058263]